jgi:hypothetical protein
VQSQLSNGNQLEIGGKQLLIPPGKNHDYNIMTFFE